MKRISGILRVIGVILLLLLAGLLVVPLILPVPPLQDIRNVNELKDPDSQFIQIQGIQVHYKKYGAGEPAIILLHGFGASTFSWREVVEPLSVHGTVIAYDRPAFGLTSRPMPKDWQGINPYSVEGNISLLVGLMDRLGVNQAILIGNSAGGRLAMQMALAHPERVSGLILVDAAIYQGGGVQSSFIRALMNTPQLNRIGPYLLRSAFAGEQGQSLISMAWHDPSKLTPEVIEGYRKPLHMENWDRALWEFTKAGSGSEDLSLRFAELTMPVLVVTGDDDRIVPTSLSLKLAEEIPQAQLVVFSNCGHVPQEECPDQFLKAVEEFLGRYKFQ
ncbi:alpha/beta fold hydrolase [Anaerolinea thermophila]|uniref:alpha/beta fold hydrolase n=2 Tax=Anaerolinea TaxID=233189 RepID=UPI0001759302|nr:alpha/beta hydrolase [Anaerolinea thermophila]